MARQKALKVVLVLVGLLFTGSIYPITTSLWKHEGSEFAPMMLSLYVALGIFLLLSVRNPSANRSLIVYAGWANLAHATVMTVQWSQRIIGRGDLMGVGLFAFIGLTLLLLAPAKPTAERASVAVAS
jgi:hypothetical protein